MTRIVVHLALAAGAVGCAARAERSVTPPLPATADTGVVIIEGPTLIGFFPRSTGAEPDSTVARRMADFRAGLHRLRDPFRRAGVRIFEQYVDTLAVRDPGGDLQIYVPPADGSGIGYYLAAPGRAPEILHGLRTEDELRTAVLRYFHHPGATRQASR